MNRLIFSAVPIVCGAALMAQDAAPQNQGGWRRVSDPAPLQDQRDQRDQRAPETPPPEQVTLPAGSYLTVRVNEGISSNQNQVGDAFTVTLVQPLVAQGFVVARRGQTSGGRVSMVEKAGRIKGTSRMAVELTDLTLADGSQLPVRTELIQYAGGTSMGRDATAIGTATGLGAAIGAAADGGFGAGVGAGAGAAASVIGVLLTRGRATTIYPEDTLTFRTLAPVMVSTDLAPQAFLPVQQTDYQTAQARPPIRRSGPAFPPYMYGGGGWGPYYPYPYFYGPSVFVYGGRGFGYGRRRW